MPFDLKKTTEIYKKYAKIPTILCANLLLSDDEQIFNIKCTKCLRNLEESNKSRLVENYTIQRHNESVVLLSKSHLVDVSSELMSSTSPDGCYRFAIHKANDPNSKTTQYLQIWNTNTRLHNINIDENEKHGSIYTDDLLGNIDWMTMANNEMLVVYTAERYKPKTKSFLKKPDDDTKDDKTIYGEEYLHAEDWGEQMVGKCAPIPCVINVQSGDVTTVDFLPSNVSFGQSVWAGPDLIYSVGYFHESHKLGLIYCSNRRSAIFKINLATKQFEIIGSQDNSVFMGCTLIPDTSKIIFFENAILGPHHQCSKLKLYDGQDVKVIIDQVYTRSDAAKYEADVGVSVQPSNGDLSCFGGFYSTTKCFAYDRRYVIASTIWGSSVQIVLVDIENAKVIRLTQDDRFGSSTLLDVKKNVIVAAVSAIDQPPHLAVGILNISDDHSVSISWSYLKNSQAFSIHINWKVINLVANDDSNDNYDCIYASKSADDKTDSSRPMIVWPHGGPHSVMTPVFNFTLALFVEYGYDVLLVNYRGSVGFGEQAIRSLLGKVGTQDVQDVQQAMEHVVQTQSIDKSRLFLFGGSHGGFLVTHLIGQYPDFYSACVARNPVIEIGSKSQASDIPDWSWTEAGIGNDITERSVLLPEHKQIMWSKSPIRYIDQVKTPTLLLIGKEDKRVPPSQGIKYHQALKARNVKTKMFLYNDCHPLSKVAVEVDSLINTLVWFDNHQ